MFTWNDLEKEFEEFSDSDLDRMSRSIGAFVYVWNPPPRLNIQDSDTDKLPDIISPRCFDMKHVQAECFRRQEVNFRNELKWAQEFYAGL